MAKRKVITPIRLRTKLPITFTLLWIVVIKVYNITGIWQGVIITMICIINLVVILVRREEKMIDIFEDKKPEQ